VFMHVKNLMGFKEYYKRYLSNENPDYVFYMFLTAKTYNEWVKVYRHFYWIILKRDYYDLEEMQECKIFALKMMFRLSYSKGDVIEEIMHYDDSLLAEQANEMDSDSIEEFIRRISLKHF